MLKVGRADIHEFLSDEAWCFPVFHNVKTRQVHRIFDVHRILKDAPDKLKGSCSEFLSVYGLLRHWVECVAPVSPELNLQKQSFTSLCHVIDILMGIKGGSIETGVGSRQLAAASSEYLVSHKAAYGVAHIKPKHHWLLDISAQVARDNIMLDLFVVERQHLLVKVYSRSNLASRWGCVSRPHALNGSSVC